jgi:hypothetical protein
LLPFTVTGFVFFGNAVWPDDCSLNGHEEAEMEINTIAATIYNLRAPDREEDATNETITLWRLPKLLWAGSILFSINLLIASSVIATPEMNFDIYGEAAANVITAGTKASPFPNAEPQPRRTVRTALKLRPIVEVAATYDAATVIPMGTERAVARPASYQLSDKQSELKRYTSMPERSVPVVRINTSEITQHGASEREPDRLVMN